MFAWLRNACSQDPGFRRLDDEAHNKLAPERPPLSRFTPNAVEELAAVLHERRVREAQEEIQPLLQDYAALHQHVDGEVADFVANGLQGTPEQAALYTLTSVAKAVSHATPTPGALIAEAATAFNKLAGEEQLTAWDYHRFDALVDKLGDIRTAFSDVTLPSWSRNPGTFVLAPDYMDSFFFTQQALQLALSGWQMPNRCDWEGQRPRSLRKAAPCAA